MGEALVDAKACSLTLMEGKPLRRGPDHDSSKMSTDLGLLADNFVHFGQFA